MTRCPAVCWAMSNPPKSSPNSARYGGCPAELASGPLELGHVVGEGRHGRPGCIEASADFSRSPEGGSDLEVDCANPKVGLHAQQALGHGPGGATGITHLQTGQSEDYSKAGA